MYPDRLQSPRLMPPRRRDDEAVVHLRRIRQIRVQQLESWPARLGAVTTSTMCNWVPPPSIKLALSARSRQAAQGPSPVLRRPAPPRSPSRPGSRILEPLRAALRVVATTVPQLPHFRAYSGCCSAERDIAYHTK